MHALVDAYAFVEDEVTEATPSNNPQLRYKAYLDATQPFRCQHVCCPGVPGPNKIMYGNPAIEIARISNVTPVTIRSCDEIETTPS
jgi:hypothetical protein